MFEEIDELNDSSGVSGSNDTSLMLLQPMDITSSSQIPCTGLGGEEAIDFVEISTDNSHYLSAIDQLARACDQSDHLLPPTVSLKTLDHRSLQGRWTYFTTAVAGACLFMYERACSPVHMSVCVVTKQHCSNNEHRQSDIYLKILRINITDQNHQMQCGLMYIFLKPKIWSLVPQQSCTVTQSCKCCSFEADSDTLTRTSSLKQLISPFSP